MQEDSFSNDDDDLDDIITDEQEDEVLGDEFTLSDSAGFRQYYYLLHSQNQTLYKLHISLIHEAYLSHREHLKKIIFQYLDNSSIHTFKITRPEQILPHIEYLRGLLTSLDQYEQHLRSILSKPLPEELVDPMKSIQRMFKADNYPSLDEIPQIKNALRDGINASQRLIEGDQFTLYILDRYDSRQILSLCQAINTYLAANNVEAGKLTDVEMPIGNYINFRQEFLKDDYQNIQKGLLESGELTNKKMMATLGVELTRAEKAQRKTIINEQKDSELYQLLSAAFPSVENPNQLALLMEENEIEIIESPYSNINANSQPTLTQTNKNNNKTGLVVDKLLKNSFLKNKEISVISKTEKAPLINNRTRSNCCSLM